MTKELKKGSCELLPVERSEVPTQVLEKVEENGVIAEMKRYRARNWRKAVESGFIFRTPKGFVVIEENCSLRDHGEVKPAWGYVFVGEADASMERVIDGLFCHTAVKVSHYGHFFPRKEA